MIPPTNPSKMILIESTKMPITAQWMGWRAIRNKTYQYTSTGAMMTDGKSKLKWASRVLRLTLAMQLCAASIGFFLHGSAASSSETPSSWLGPSLPDSASWVLSFGLVLLAASIVLGLYKRSSLLISALLLVVSSWIHLYYAFRVLKQDRVAVMFYGWTKIDTFFEAWRGAGFQPVGHVVFRKSYSSKSRFLRYQHEQAFLLAKAARPCRSTRLEM
jgi:hypothetical protein